MNSRAVLVLVVCAVGCRDPLEPAEPPEEVDVRTSFARAMVLFQGHDCNAVNGPSLCAIDCRGEGSSCERTDTGVTCRCAQAPRIDEPERPLDPRPRFQATWVSSCGCDVPDGCIRVCGGPSVASCNCGLERPDCACVAGSTRDAPVVVVPIVPVPAK